MKASTGFQQAADRHESLRRCSHLRDTIARRAVERAHSVTDVASILGMSPGHWYRIKKEPLRFASLTMERLEAISRYVGWTRLQVMIAVGWVHQSEVDQVLSAEGTLQDALARLERAAIVNGLATPLRKAAEDHRLLMARLLILAEAGVAVPSPDHSTGSDRPSGYPE